MTQLFAHNSVSFFIKIEQKYVHAVVSVIDDSMLFSSVLQELRFETYDITYDITNEFYFFFHKKADAMPPSKKIRSKSPLIRCSGMTQAFNLSFMQLHRLFIMEGKKLENTLLKKVIIFCGIFHAQSLRNTK